MSKFTDHYLDVLPVMQLQNTLDEICLIANITESLKVNVDDLALNLDDGSNVPTS